VNVRAQDSSRAEAEAKLYREILKKCEKDRRDRHVPLCSEGDCPGKPTCMQLFEINQNAVRRYRSRKLGRPAVWVYSYQGNVRHYCRCVEVLPEEK